MKRKHSLTSALISFLVVVCITVSLSCGIFAEPAEAEAEAPLTLVANGASDYVIVVGEETWGKDPTNTINGESVLGGEYQAALDLSMYIKNMTGVEIPVKKDTEVPIEDNEKVITVGKTNRESSGKVTVDRDALGEDGFTIKTVGNTLYIIGARPRGTGFAVYELLEKYFGCRFYLEELQTWPENVETLTLEPIENYTYVPYFEARLFSYRKGSNFAAAKTAAKANGHYGSGEVYGGNYAHSSPSGDSNFVHTINRFLGVDYHYYDDSYQCENCNTVYEANQCITCGNMLDTEEGLAKHNALGCDGDEIKYNPRKKCSNPDCPSPQRFKDMKICQWNIYDFSEYRCESCDTLYHDLDKVAGTDQFWRNAQDTQKCTNPDCPNPQTKKQMQIALTRKVDTHLYIANSWLPNRQLRFQACYTTLNPFIQEYAPDRVLSSVRQWLYESTVKRGRVNDRQIALSQFDASRWYGGCQCRNCVAMENLYEAASGNWIWLCNYVARAIKDEYPMIKVNTLSYLYTDEAPKNIKAEDNVSVFLCSNDVCLAHPYGECGKAIRYDDTEGYGNTNNSDMTKRVSEWQKVSDHLIAYEYYRSTEDDRWIFPVTYQIFYNYKWYRDLGFDGMYSYMEDSEDGFDSLNRYLVCKMMWNPEMTIDEYQALIDDYCNAIYGPGGAEMSEIVKAYHEHSLSGGKCWGMPTTNLFNVMPSTINETENETDRVIELDYSFVNKVQALYDSAYAKAETDAQRDKIDRQYLGFVYYKLMDLHNIKEVLASSTDKNTSYSIKGFDISSVDSQIRASADKVIELLVKFNLNKIGVYCPEGEDPNNRDCYVTNTIDLSAAASFDRMAKPTEW